MDSRSCSTPLLSKRPGDGQNPRAVVTTYLFCGNAKHQLEVAIVKSVAVFNNKGGVGKTTLLCNLAAYLSLRNGIKVLVVDADPQCNATQAMFSDKIVEKLYSSRSFTIQSIVQPLSLGKGYTDEIHPLRSDSFGTDVIPGDPRLALKEDLLANDWKDATSGSARGLRTSYMFVQLLELCHAYDIVFFDMGPSLGSINRAVLIAADFFISPMSSDIFSIKAIENIAEAMTAWSGDLAQGLARNADPQELPKNASKWDIRFAGYVLQQYFAKRDASGQPRAVGAFDRIMKKIPSSIGDNFVKRLQPDAPRVNYDLGTVPNLFSLIPMSQSSHKPVFELKASDGVVGAHFTKVKESGEIFGAIAGRLQHNLKLLTSK